MNLASTPAMQAASQSTPADPLQAGVQVRVLKKALEAQEAAAAALLQSLPSPPVPQGPLGTRLDVYA